MRRTRLTILGLMGIVLLLAAMLAALKHPGALISGCFQAANLMLLLTAILGAIFTRGRPRAFWVGFALFGWFFAVNDLSSVLGDDKLDAQKAVLAELGPMLFDTMHPDEREQELARYTNPFHRARAANALASNRDQLYESFVRTLRTFFCLAAATAGGAIGYRFAKRTEPQANRTTQQCAHTLDGGTAPGVR